MSEADALRIITQVAQGLHRIHQENLIHRDVNLHSILLRTDGVAKLGGLGLVMEAEAGPNLARTGRGLGRPGFMAPEQFRNAGVGDARCDIYCLGAILYVMVTGELPFQATGPLDAWVKKVQNDLVPPRTWVPDLSERINGAILRARAGHAV
jgi:serine/threonine-protein kinase